MKSEVAKKMEENMPPSAKAWADMYAELLALTRVYAEASSKEQKDELISQAIKTSTQILMYALLLTGSKTFIKGTMVFEDGSSWKLDFHKMDAENNL